MTSVMKVRKGARVVINGVRVEVTKREKWNSKDVKLHYRDCGYGLPAGEICRGATGEKFFRLTDHIPTWSPAAPSDAVALAVATVLAGA